MAHLLRNTAWLRSAENPVIYPERGGRFGENICMNPCVVHENDVYYIYYAAEDELGRRNIRLATADAKDPGRITPRGVVVSNGREGDFDYKWCVYPQVTKIAGRWHLYYTGNRGSGEGLSAFPGIGLAVSDDLINWRKHEAGPVLTPAGGGIEHVGIAGGGITQEQVDGATEYRFYYTACPTLGDNVFLDQQKAVYYATSSDGISWRKRGCVMRRRAEMDYENIAVTAATVIKEDGLYRMWYSAIGMRWGFYSICYAESRDGISWERGEAYGENLQLGPEDRVSMRHACERPKWDSQMAAYPSVVFEDGRLRMLYTGNEYGVGGIGVALSAPLRAAAAYRDDGSVRIWAQGRDGCSELALLGGISLDGETPEYGRCVYGQTHSCDIWMERELKTRAARVRARMLVMHGEDGLLLHCTLTNEGERDLGDIHVKMSCGDDFAITWDDCAFERCDGGVELHAGALQAGKTVNLHGHIRPR